MDRELDDALKSFGEAIRLRPDNGETATR